MTIHIVTDSASDISLEEAKELGIEIVPLSVRFGEAEYTDLIDLSVSDFYQKMSESDLLPSTAAPSPGAFEAAFKRCIEALSGANDEARCSSSAHHLGSRVQLLLEQ